MPNNIELIQGYVNLLDEVYKKASCTSVLDTPDRLIRTTPDPKSVLIPKIAMAGLGDYDRVDGFADGDVSLEWESHTFRYDRGRSFSVDDMDDVETLGATFGNLTGEFVRTKVAPEVDAIRFNEYATNAGKVESGAVTADNVLELVAAAIAEMKDKEVDLSKAVLFMTSSIEQMLNNSTKLTRGLLLGQDVTEMKRIIVPSGRFIKGITLNDGRTEGQTDGGFIKTAESGQQINFMIVDPKAVCQITKRAKSRIFTPDVNQKKDAYKFDYRLYHDAWVLENKVDGIYCHTAG